MNRPGDQRSERLWIRGIYYLACCSGRLAYIVYGRKQMHGMALVSGILLCVFPYFVSSIWLVLLMAALLMALPRFIDFWSALQNSASGRWGQRPSNTINPDIQRRVRQWFSFHAWKTPRRESLWRGYKSGSGSSIFLSWT